MPDTSPPVNLAGERRIVTVLFCDVSGIRAIVATAANLDGGRRMFLHGLDPQLQKVFKVVGWAGMQSLVIDAGWLNH